MVSKVVINLLIQPANWAVRNSRVGYAYILVGKLSVLPDFAETLHHEAHAELVADQSKSLLLKRIKHPHIKGLLLLFASWCKSPLQYRPNRGYELLCA